MKRALLSTSFVFALLGASHVRADDSENRAHAPVRVLVATRDLAYNETVRPEDVEERTVEAQWISSSEVQASSRHYIENQRIQMPVHKGDLMFWAMFEVSIQPWPELREACSRATGGVTTAPEQLAQVRARILRRAR